MVIHVQFIICGVGSLVSGEIFPELSLSPLLRNIQPEEDYQLCSNAMGCYLEPQKLKEKLVVQIQR
jgi:hypothetical protein